MNAIIGRDMDVWRRSKCVLYMRGTRLDLSKIDIKVFYKLHVLLQCDHQEVSLLSRHLNLVKYLFEQQTTTEVVLCKSCIQTISSLASSAFYLLKPWARNPGLFYGEIYQEEEQRSTRLVSKETILDDVQFYEPLKNPAQPLFVMQNHVRM